MTDRPDFTPANSRQAQYWNTVAGEKWVAYQEEIDTLVASVTARLLERAMPEAGAQLLDIGCGAGATSFAFAEAVGAGGQVTGIDISEPLLALAEQRRAAAGLDQVTFLLADAQTYDFEPGSVDLVVSRFGVMFFEDPVAAFSNMARALRPGGRLIFAAWGSLGNNPWFEIPKNVAAARLGEPSPTPPRAPGPMAFAEIDYVEGILREAGLTEGRGAAEALELFSAGSVAEVAGLSSNLGPSTRIIEEYKGTAEDVAAIREAIAFALEPFAVEGGVSIPASLNFFEATNA